MNPELEKFIDLTLIDGVLTEKEKKIIYKKAQESGFDLDELEVILEAKLYQKKQSENFTEKKTASSMTKKCPVCNSFIQPFQSNCSYCNHELTNIEATASIQKLFLLLTECDNAREQNEEFTLGSALGGIFAKAYGLGSGDKVLEKKKSIISSFPIPNTREDILEFLSLALPNSKQKGNFLTKHQPENKTHNDLAPTWFSKCEQVIIKARFIMKEDKETLNQIEYYAKQMEIR